ncbi:uncharacterized protein LOC124161136 [Ischnura elegans]|uniref:uncharacterized protein LOC124161136 n=1 Tax=Ischnura elegans TaxID=197161 RepID=UPI001ED8AA56|nr:uncharacterized protein LOC124161136 [Ischnura elegans]
MKVLCIVLFCAVAALARPQIIHPWPATIAAAPMWSHGHSMPVVMARHGLWPYTTQAAAAVPVVVRYPSQDTSRGLPQPVEDTPEVRAAKMAFAAEYEKAAVAAALSPSTEDIADGSALVIIPRAESKIVPAAVAVLKDSEMERSDDEGRSRSRREAKEPIMMAEKKMMLITPASTTRMGMSLDVADYVVPQHPVIPVPVPLAPVSPIAPVAVPVVAVPAKAAAGAPEGAFIVPHGQPIIYTGPAAPLIPPVVLLKKEEPTKH